MILSDVDIKRAIEAGTIRLDPFDESRLKQASYTLTLGATVLIPKPLLLGQVVEPDKTEISYKTVELGTDGYVMRPGTFVLASVAERVSIAPSLAAYLDARTSLARLGLNVLQGSTFIEPGQHDSHETLEVTNVGPYPIRLVAGMKIVKIVFHTLQNEASSAYSGSYAAQSDGAVRY